jgi:hypothetical protein
MKHLFFVCSFAAISSSAFAGEIRGISFSHQEWEVFCSNTGTCRAAGYQHDDGSNPASLLLTRQAGAKQAVKAEFALSDFDETLSAHKLKNIHFYVNGKDLGAVAVDETEMPLMGNLSANQVNALLQQSTQKAEIVFKNAHYQWQVSDAGMTAVLLKMDDFQKRIGTVGALVKKGKADESKVLAAQPKLMVKQVKTASKPYLTLQPQNLKYQAVYRSLMAAKPKNADYDVCEGVYDSGSDHTQPQAIDLYKLSNHKVLAMTLCWRAAYNEGYGAWVLDESLTGHATFVTAAASESDAGMIYSSQKGRGIGDCWSSEQWVWDGQRFVQTVDSWSGMCKGLAAGGVWSLDKVESVVK